MNYVYYLLATWVFVYLVQERHFTVLEGGLLASAPPLAAAVGAGVGGYAAGVLSARFGSAGDCESSRCCRCRRPACCSSSPWMP